MELNLKTQQNKLISLFRVSLMFFLFFFVQQTVASSQSITLPSHNITIKDAFSEIEKQTGMSVDYDESVINLNKQVNASVNNKSLNETLALILKESGCTFVIRNNHIIISAQTVQQQQKQVTISGTVSDNLGPIAGANVVEKGTTNGIITDMDGNYTLSVPQGAVIQFSYIGYVTKEITVDSRRTSTCSWRKTHRSWTKSSSSVMGRPRKATWPGLLSVPIWELCRNHRISAWVRHYRGRFPD